MTELQFLLDLILDTKTITEVRRKCKERVGTLGTPSVPIQRQVLPPQLAQSPSTIAAQERHAAQGMAPLPITPQAAAALAARQEAIAIAVSGKEEKGRMSPRKF